MSKFTCSCGHIIDLVHSPTPEQLLMFPESTINDIAEGFGKGKMAEEPFYELVDKHAKRVLVCPQCDRLWIQQQLGQSYVAFKKEE